MTTPPDDTHEAETGTATEEAAEQAVGPSPRVRLGTRLSQARQSRQMSLGEASDRLRIRQNYLQALETGDWTPLPEEVYVMGFLRQYAALLGVDISADIDALKTGEYQLTKPFTMPDPPIAMNRAWAITAAACFFVLLILFNVVDDEDNGMTRHEPPATLPLVGEQTGDQVGDRIGEQTGDQTEVQADEAPVETESMSLEPEQPADAAPGTPSGETETPAAAVDETAASTASQDAAPTVSAESTSNVAIEPTPAPTVVTVIDAASGSDATASHSYQITAVDQDVWLQLHAPDGSLVKEALLRAGQGMRLGSDAAFLQLTAGNPLALRISIDGNVIAEPGTLGEKDKVLHDYRLDPAKP